MQVRLYKHFGPPYRSWVAHVPQLNVLMEYQLDIGCSNQPIIHDSLTPKDDAQLCSRLEFLVLFGVTEEDIRKEARRYRRCV